MTDLMMMTVMLMMMRAISENDDVDDDDIGPVIQTLEMHHGYDVDLDDGYKNDDDNEVHKDNGDCIITMMVNIGDIKHSFGI